MNDILVSIITPTYNSSEFISRTYDSIKNQTYSNWEWLVTDDCSTDGTFKLLECLVVIDERIKIFENNVNSGAAVSRNVSLSHVRGELIAFIDSDDLWSPNKLERQVEFMGEAIDFSFTAYELMDWAGSLLNKKVDASQVGSFDYADMLRKKATMGCSTVMLRREVFVDVSMPLLRTGQDYALWLKLLRSGKDAYILNEVLTQYRVLPNSISRNKFRKAKRQWQIYREVEGINILESIVNFCFYALRAVFRK